MVFAAVAWRVVHDTRVTRQLTLLGCLFVGNEAVALIGDPLANWGLTALYSDTFHLLPRVFGLGLSPAQSWAVVFAYPWCFPMLAFGGRVLARRAGGGSAVAGFVAGAVLGGLVFAVFVYLLFVPQQVIVYQRSPPVVTIHPGTPTQRNLLDALGVATYVGACSAGSPPPTGRACSPPARSAWGSSSPASRRRSAPGSSASTRRPGSPYRRMRRSRSTDRGALHAPAPRSYRGA